MGLSKSLKYKLMKKLKSYLIIILLLLTGYSTTYAQRTSVWNNKQCAVVLTYDDAIDVDLDNVLPALDSLGLKGTFYLIGSSPVVANRMEQWREGARHGQEVGNHFLFHPREGSRP